ncbi:pharyngeal muscle protein 2 isoform X2 [Hetaerina americana]|uniref:pharyngeal muscle protein 2 isoform X2 n=1 Tax=Hetaerina americana TaxID=62018 RepID=UPI003A7F4228
MMAAAAAAAVASAATVSPGLVPPPPGQKVLSVRHYEAGPPLPEEGEAILAKGKDGKSNAVPGSEAAGEPIEEEWVTRKRVELTTTRQTETRVKRQVELDEEGRVVGDSGPIVTTNTTEDTRSEEQKHTEGFLVAVREKKDVRTTAAVDSTALAPEGPRIVRQTAKGHKVVDTEDTEEASLATPDGRLLTETKTQHQHVEEDIVEDDDDDGKDLPDEEIEGEGKSHNYVRTKEEEIVSYLSNGVKIAEEMKYRAEGFEGEKETGDETDAPPRLRALKPRLSSKGVHPPSPAGGERKDALTKRPLDLDAEEETRKVETSKWLEHHFGSDSRSSREGSAGGFEDPESPFYGGVTPGGGSYIGITMKSKTNNLVGKDAVTPTDIREPLRTSPLPSSMKTNGIANGYNSSKAPEPISPPPMPTTNGYHHHHTETEITRTTRTSSGSGGQGILGRKDVIQVLPTGPGRTFRPPRGVAAPPPSTTELTHVEPQKRKKRPPPQPLWTAEANGEEDERVEGRNSRPWSPEENGRRGSGDDLIGRNMSPNFLSGPKPYRPSTISSPSDHSWNNRTEEATVSWANGVTEHQHVVVTNGDGHHHHHGSTGHLASPSSPAPPPQEGLRVARTRRRAPPIPGTPETNGAVHEAHIPAPPVMSPQEKKQTHQKTRFADEEEDEDDEEEIIDVGRDERVNGKKANKKVKKKKSGSFGDSIRRLVGRLRSRSSEKKKGKEEQGGRQNGHHPPQQQKTLSNGHGNARRGSWRSSSRSPSPDEYGEPTYRRYQTAIDGNIRPSLKRQQEDRHRDQHHERGDLNGRQRGGGRPVGVRRESSPNEATSEEEEPYEGEGTVDGRDGIGVVVGGPVAPPRSRPATTTSSSSYQGHLPVTQQHRGLQAESSGGSSYRHHQHARGHHHVVGGRGTRQHLQVSSPSRRTNSPATRQSNETSSRGETDRSWKGSSSRGRRDYGAEVGSSGGGSSSRRRNSAYSPERGSAPFSSTNSEGEGGRRREADRVPPLLTSTPMDYDKKHSSYTARREEAGNHVQRFYLGEDPFGGSIYGREREYEGVKRSSRQRGHGDEQKKSSVRYGATLGRPTGSGTNHSSSYHSHTETTRAQTLPRKLRHSPPHPNTNHVSTTTSTVRRQLYADSPSTNSFSKNKGLQRHTGSLINVSIVNNVTPGGNNNRAPPAKPARTYRSSLSRSKSFNVHGNQDDEVDSSLPRHNKLINGDNWESQASRYRSNPQLSRILHEESPLKSPGIISSINRSQRDLRDAVREESNTRFADMIRKEEEGHLKRKEWTPKNFKERNGIVSGGLSGDKNAGGRSESVRITTVSDGPSVTRTVRNFEKRSSGDGVNGGSGRLETTYEATTTVTESRTRPTSIWNRNRKSVLGPGFSESTGNGGVVIEVRNGRL